MAKIEVIEPRMRCLMYQTYWWPETGQGAHELAHLLEPVVKADNTVTERWEVSGPAANIVSDTL